jgi:hypothetical protein
MRREHDGDRKGSGRLDSVHAQRLTAFSLQPKHLSSYKQIMHPKNSDRLRNYSILPVIASTRRVRGNRSAIMRDCFTSFAMTTFLLLFLGLFLGDTHRLAQ